MTSVGPGTVLAGKWELVRLLGEGSCGKVYLARSTDKSKSLEYEVVCKVIPTGSNLKGKASKEQDRLANTLNYEYLLYQGVLSGFPYAPRLPAKFYGLDMSVRYLVMERLEMDLTEWSCKFPAINEIAAVGIQLLKGLEWLHKKGYLFIDIKPQNFMMKNGSVYFVDYGLVERWVAHDSSGSRASEQRQIVGTPAFLGVNVHRGETPSRRDEIEALGLVLLSLTQRGKLPWSNCSSDEDCRKMKETCDISSLASEYGCPELGEIIQVARGCSFASAPPYDAIEALLLQMQQREPTKVTHKRSRASSSKLSSEKSISESVPSSVTETSNILDYAVSEKSSVIDVSTHDVSKKPRRQVLTSVKEPATKSKRVAKVASKSLKMESLEEVENIHEVNSLNATVSSTAKASRIRDVSDRFSVDSNAPFTSNKKSVAMEKSSDLDNFFTRGQFSVIEGPHKGHQFHLMDYLKSANDVAILGRREDIGMISLHRDECVSENHLTLSVGKLGEIKIKDVSTYGTKLDGVKMKKRWYSLTDGNRLTVGDSVLVFSMTP